MHCMALMSRSEDSLWELGLSSTKWVPEVKLRPPGLVVGALVHRALLLTPEHFLFHKIIFISAQMLI